MRIRFKKNIKTAQRDQFVHHEPSQLAPIDEQMELSQPDDGLSALLEQMEIDTEQTPKVQPSYQTMRLSARYDATDTEPKLKIKFAFAAETCATSTQSKKAPKLKFTVKAKSTSDLPSTALEAVNEIKKAAPRIKLRVNATKVTQDLPSAPEQSPTTKRRIVHKSDSQSNSPQPIKFFTSRQRSKSVDTENSPKIKRFFTSRLRKVKQEKIALSLTDLKAKMSDAIKKAREGDNTLDNCGFLSEFAVQGLQKILQGEEITDFNVATEDSRLYSYSYLLPKEQNQPTEHTNSYDDSKAIVSNRGIHSMLPPEETFTYAISDEGLFQENLTLDLTAEIISRSKLKLEDFDLVMTRCAAQENICLIGHINLNPTNLNESCHLIAFCATPFETFFIDGHFYNGITRQGEPVFNNLGTAYSFVNEQNPAGIYDDTIFFMIHHKVKADIIADHAHSNRPSF